VIVVLISPRHADLPYTTWLADAADRVVAVHPAGAAICPGFDETIAVPDYTDTPTVLAVARQLHSAADPVRAILALAEVDVERAALLRAEFGLPGLDPAGARAYRDKVTMKEYARAAGLPMAPFAPVSGVEDVLDFQRAHPGRIVLKPRDGSGATGLAFCSTADDVRALAGALRATPYEVETFVEGQVFHVDAFRVDGRWIAIVPSAYTGAGCLSHWSDEALCSYTLGPDNPLRDRLTAQTRQLVDALPSPPTITVHAEYFGTPTGEVLFCEVAGRLGGGPIPQTLRRVLGIDPRELWSRIECGLPVDLDAVSAHVTRAPLVGFCSVPPRDSVVTRLADPPRDALDFRYGTRVGDDWRGERYAQRKCTDNVAAWTLVGRDEADLVTRIETTAAEVTTGFGWSHQLSGALR